MRRRFGSEPYTVNPIVALFLISAWGAPFVSLRWREYRVIRHAGAIQTKLEDFRKNHGHFPEALTEVGFADPAYGHLTCQRFSDSTYRLRFLKRPGALATFDSTGSDWH